MNRKKLKIEFKLEVPGSWDRYSDDEIQESVILAIVEAAEADHLQRIIRRTIQLMNNFEKTDHAEEEELQVSLISNIWSYGIRHSIASTLLPFQEK